MKSLVICADDYALSEPISLAIETLAKNKRISATSVMSLSPLWPSHSASLQSLKGQIDVGLHLDWTSEFAIANGHGGSLNSVMLKSLLGQNSIADCKKIIHQQLDWFWYDDESDDANDVDTSTNIVGGTGKVESKATPSAKRQRN